MYWLMMILAGFIAAWAGMSALAFKRECSPAISIGGGFLAACLGLLGFIYLAILLNGPK